MKPSRIVGADWQPEKSLVVLKGEDGAELVMSLGEIATLGTQARRVISALQIRGQGLPPGVRRIAPLPVQTFRIQTTRSETGDWCLLTLDPDTDVEIQLSLQDPKAVRELARHMVEVADRMTSEPEPRN